MEQIIDILLNNFDISYMLSINILTYMVIKVIDYFNKDKKVKLIIKRIVLIICSAICCVLYSLTTDIEHHVMINSTIAAPVFYSWVIKPLLNKYNLNYNNNEKL